MDGTNNVIIVKLVVKKVLSGSAAIASRANCSEMRVYLVWVSFESLPVIHRQCSTPYAEPVALRSEILPGQKLIINDNT